MRTEITNTARTMPGSSRRALTACTAALLLLLSLLSPVWAVPASAAVSLEDIPAYSGEPFTVVDDNGPDFPSEDMTTSSFESYSALDYLGRCGEAYACIGEDLMPTQKRGNISQIHPTGWCQNTYDFVDGGSLYNRCHLIAHQLTAEDANEYNLITGTRYLNTEGMLPFENMVADYIHETGCHVLYRVTPIFDGYDLLARGVQMEAYSVEDDGESICFNIFAYNVQPGVELDYATGENWLASEEISPSSEEGMIRGNSRSYIYHCPGQRDYDKMADSKHLVLFSSEEEAQAAGYRRAQQ